MTDHHSDPTLLRAYRKINVEYFGGELPEENIVLCWEPHEGLCGVTDRVYDARTEKDAGDFIIRIDPRFQHTAWAWKVILIHECVHIKLWPHRGQHPAAFDREIQRLCGFKSYRRLL